MCDQSGEGRSSARRARVAPDRSSANRGRRASEAATSDGLFPIDLHVHTGRYSQCAELVDPFGIAAAATRAGLAGVVITEHDMLWQDEEFEILCGRSPGVKLYRGIEVSARGCHLVVIGIEDAGPLFRGATLEEVVAIAHRDAAAVILCHPYRDGDAGQLPADLVDAIEIASTSVTASEGRRAVELANLLGKPCVAASDGHSLTRIGRAYTVFPSLPASESELAAMIRAGLGRPVAEFPDSSADEAAAR